MLRKMLCLAAATFFTQAASANVVYTWQQVEHAASVPDGLRLELVFKDAAVAKGALAFDLENLCGFGICNEQQDSLLSLRYWYAGADGGQQWNLIDYRYQDEMKPGLQRMSMNLRFLADGHLSGSIMANDGYSDFTMLSSGNVFSMLWAHSDEQEGCGTDYPACEGERGLLRTDAMPVQPVPEPGSLAMLAAGGLAGWLARRRKAGAVQGSRM